MFERLTCLISVVFVWGLALASPAQAELVGWWRLDEGSGTTAFDSSGNGNDATFEGSPVWVQAGKLGSALRFNGSSDYLAAPDSESLDINADQLSIAAWINGEDWPGANHVLRKIADTGTGAIYMIRVQPDTVRVYLNTSAADTIVQGTTVLATNEWIHIAVTYDGAEARIYIDGQLEVAMDVSGEVTQSDNELRIGRGEPAGYFMGMIDDVRLYNHALTEDELLAAMEGGGAAYPSAPHGPNPANGALHPETWVNLGWGPGDFAVTHDVYIGDSFDDVNNGTAEAFRANQAETLFIIGFPGFPFPDGLVPGTTYYWRIDEVNDADPNSPWKGDIWSFSIPPKTAYNPDPADGAEFVDPNAVFTWTGGYGSMLHTVYLGDNYDDVNSATGGVPLGAASYDPGTLDAEKVIYWRVDEFDGAETHKGDIWSFTTPGAVGNPQPANGAADVQTIDTLSWTPADNAASHELYFGADADAVGSATTASPEYAGPKALGSESYDPGGLALDSGYAWRVDEVYPTGTVKGLVWTFTTADFLLVDDFESYDDVDPLPGEPGINRIFDRWIDGFGTLSNGAVVGNALPPYAEQTVVHGGAQSMNYAYDNAAKTSEATLTLLWPRDWTAEAEGVTKLSLWFRGSAGNAADRIYIALNGSAVVYHDDASATQLTGWNQWVIDLAAFGVGLTNVNSVAIGVGTKNAPAPGGGTGTIYIDDMRLYR